MLDLLPDNETMVHNCLNCGAYLSEAEYHLRICPSCKLRWVDDGVSIIFNRCCGRCSEIGDTCVAYRVCNIHKIQGCEMCFGQRGQKIFTKRF